MKIVVTGGAGFIGSNYIYYSLETYPEDEIVCLDLLTYAGNLATLGLYEKSNWKNMRLHRFRRNVFHVVKLKSNLLASDSRCFFHFRNKGYG